MTEHDQTKEERVAALKMELRILNVSERKIAFLAKAYNSAPPELSPSKYVDNLKRGASNWLTSP